MAHSIKQITRFKMSIDEARALLPTYSKGEERCNYISHALGAVFGVFVLIACLSVSDGVRETVVSIVYGVSLILLYSVSAIYHHMPVGEAKVRMRTVDHCTIYLLIAGTYTPATLAGVWKADETMAWTMFFIVWGLLVPAVVLTAIDTKKFLPVSMACYVVMGWCVAIDFPAAIEGLGSEGFAFLLSGGIAYTIGAVVYGIGKKLKYMHSVFHVLVLAGSVLQFISIYAYALR